MENKNATNLISYPDAWNDIYGNNLENLANKILKFEEIQRLKLESVLDIECENSKMLNIFAKSEKKCYGITTNEELFNYSKNTYPNLEISKVDSILDLDNLPRFDLITCVNQTINNIDSLQNLQDFFDNVYAHLKNGGVFICNYFTNLYFENNAKTIYDENENYNYLRKITKISGNKYEILENFYLKRNVPDKINRFDKIQDKKSKYTYNNYEIIKAITNSKFRYLITTNSNLSPVKDFNNSPIAHIIAIKREN